jgi:hypothetical protein
VMERYFEVPDVCCTPDIPAPTANNTAH